jgi:hypothetical protein
VAAVITAAMNFGRARPVASQATVTDAPTSLPAVTLAPGSSQPAQVRTAAPVATVVPATASQGEATEKVVNLKPLPTATQASSEDAEVKQAPTLAPTFTRSPVPTLAPTATQRSAARFTATATPKATRPPVDSLPAPVLLSPVENETVSGPASFSWRWDGPSLAANQGFEVRIWKAGQPDHYGAAEPTGSSGLTINAPASYGVQQGGPGAYFWTVAVVQRSPYQRTGPEALPRRLQIPGGGGGGGGGLPPTHEPPLP